MLAWKLLLKEPASHARHATYQTPSITIGRAPECDLQLQDRFSSGKHATLTFASAGLFLLKDLGSANGTFVNGKPVSEVYVRAGDQVTMGRTILTICGDQDRDGVEEEREITAVMPRSAVTGEAVVGGTAFKALTQGLKALARDGSTDESLAAILNAAIAAVDGDCGYIFLRDGDKNRWRLAAQSGVSQLPKELEESPSPKELPSQSVVRAVLQTGQNFICSNLSDDQTYGKQESVVVQSIAAVLCAPISIGKNRLGAIYVDRRGLASQAKPPLEKQHAEVFESFARMAATCVHNGRLIQDLDREVAARATLQRYVSPQIVEQVMNRKQAQTLGGVALQVSVMFTDIRGFTKYSSEVPPERLVQQLNEYFAVMSRIILQHDGYLDKFIGDAIMAVFGVPTPRPDDAKRAVRCALEIQRRQQQLNAEWRQRGWKELETGIGINSGKVVSGNIGSTQRMEYTVLGDTVNVASRLCSVADAGQVVAAQSTKHGLEDDYDFDSLELPELKGKAEGSVTAYSVKMRHG